MNTTEKLEWLSLKDTARVLGWTAQRARKLWSLPDFPGFKCGRRYVVDREMFLRWYRGEHKQGVKTNGV